MDYKLDKFEAAELVKFWARQIDNLMHECCDWEIDGIKDELHKALTNISCLAEAFGPPED